MSSWKSRFLGTPEINPYIASSSFSPPLTDRGEFFDPKDVAEGSLFPEKGQDSGWRSGQDSSLYINIDGNVKTASDGGVSIGGGIAMSNVADFYSPWLSTDYLELPRSYSEERRWYRFFYDQEPLVGRAIDLKTFIPLSKMALSVPRTRSKMLSKKVHAFYQNLWTDLKLNEKLRWIVHEYNLIGEVIAYFEWDDDLNTWTKVLLLDPDMCEVQFMPYKDETRIFLRPPNNIDTDMIEDLKNSEGYSDLAQAIDDFSEDFRSDLAGNAIELNTDPRKGSFAKYLGRRRSPYKPGPGVSILRRLLRPLLFRDKIRQALTQITSRHMTPVRLVWAEGLSEEQVDELRNQVDFALMGPDFSIVTNYELNWQEITAEGRLFDATSVMERNTEEILIGLGMTKELLLGEGSYGAGRITLQVLDTEYSMIRDDIQDMVNELFRVVAEKQRFVETDISSGMSHYVYSSLKFSRMALKDYADVFDFFWNLYQNGALDKDTLLEFFNLDPVDIESRLRRDFLTINDNLSDEFRRSIYNEVSSRVIEETNIVDRVINGFGLAGKTINTFGVDGDSLSGEGDNLDFGGDFEFEESGPDMFESMEETDDTPIDEEIPSSDIDDLFEELGESTAAPESARINSMKEVKLPETMGGPRGPII